MRIPFVFLLILALTLSGCNMPAASTATSTASVPEPLGVGMPAFFTNTSHTDGPAVPSGPQVGSKMVWVDNSILVFVPGGDFVMGVDDGVDNPIHTVTLSPFWIYRAEVTNTQYALCIASGECSAPQDPEAAAKLSEPALRDHPVIGVTYAQSEAYCKWIQGDLPTEAQWEKTARGPGANKYPWGEEGPTCDLTNFSSCDLQTTNIREHLNGKSHYEALDLAGNVFEWVLDWYDPQYYQTGPASDPPGPSNGIERGVRGGGYQTVEADLFSARRFSYDPLKTRPDLGFRCVVNHPTMFAPYCEASPLFTANSLPGQPGSEESSPSCEPPNAYVGGSYCSDHVGYVNVFTDGEVSSPSGELACAPAADGLVTCSGPDFFSGEVQVCGECEAPPVQEQEPAEGQAVVPPGPGDACPNPAYRFNEDTQNCEWPGDPGVPFEMAGDVFCPIGSEPDPTGSICTAPPQPADGMGECPSWGYYYDPASQMCLWRETQSGAVGICLDPETGFGVDHSRCEPGGDLGGYTYLCPLGMELDAGGEFCVQVAAVDENVAAECANGICDPAGAENDFACPVGTYFDPGVEVCVPAGDPGAVACIAGFALDPERACCGSITNTSSAACAPGQLLDPLLGCMSVPAGNVAQGSSCISAPVNLPRCSRTGGDIPGGDDIPGGNICPQHNGNYSACIAAGCSYDTLTNTCN